MRTLTIALSLGLIAAAAPPEGPKPAAPAKPAAPMCQLRTTRPATTPATRLNRVRKLLEMPPARQIKTVIRSFGGCEVPVIVRENIGGD